jgi:predicted nucleotidyltransferase
MRLELRIVDLLSKYAGKKLTINEIAKSLDEHYSLVHRTVSRLAKDGVINIAKAGNSHLCSLDFESEKTLALMQLGEIEKKAELYNENRELGLVLEDLTRSIGTKDVDSIILFGSHAKGTATKESDIDILLVAKGRIETGRIAKDIYARYGKEVNIITLSPAEFRRQKGKAIVKEIIGSHYVLYGAGAFVKLVSR